MLFYHLVPASPDDRLLSDILTCKCDGHPIKPTPHVADLTF